MKSPYGKLLPIASTCGPELTPDLIVANDVTAPGAGFDLDTNVVTIFGANGREQALPKMTKLQVAHRILDQVVELIRSAHRVTSSSESR